ncbi:glycosyltransferase family 4 protein [Candidatus Sumerlaeota bacterium]|nr:glycosyltransferase family 4 protein [Candidatus Sumerlaeota bacterium]
MVTRSPDVALISYIVSDNMLDELTRIDPTPAIQTQRFGLVLLRLLESSTNRLSSYNFVPIQDFPIGRRIWFGAATHRRGGRDILSLPFVNIVGLKHVTRLIALLLRFRTLCRFDTIVVHGLHLPNLVAAVFLKAIGVRIGVVLTDRQGVVLPTDGRIRRWLKVIDRGISVSLARRFDFGIALSDTLAQTYVPGRPVILLPGIFDDMLERRVAVCPRDRHEDAFRVVYFGGLSTEYGIAALLDTLPLLDSRVQVRIFGRGPLEEAIAAASAHHPNVFWGGLVNQDRLVREMADCDLLINPRPARGLLAQMSSPSKLIEYAASGRPVMTTRLPSLTSDLMEWLLPIDDETAPGIAQAINAASNLSRAVLNEYGINFRAAVKRGYSIASLQASLAPLLGCVGKTADRTIDKLGADTK